MLLMLAEMARIAASADTRDVLDTRYPANCKYQGCGVRLKINRLLLLISYILQLLFKELNKTIIF